MRDGICFTKVFGNKSSLSYRWRNSHFVDGYCQELCQDEQVEQVAVAEAPAVNQALGSNPKSLFHFVAVSGFLPLPCRGT